MLRALTFSGAWWNQIATAMSSVESKQLAAAKGVPGAGNTTTIKSAVTVTAASLGFTLKKEQEVCIFQFASGKDVFVSLPTGYGKSLC